MPWASSSALYAATSMLPSGRLSAASCGTARISPCSRSVLIANGSDDHPYVDTADYLAGALARATQLTIPGADHLTALTHPELRSAVVDFLARPPR
jgi:pimeloyl-ACP methyl ester carboxylesterase